MDVQHMKELKRICQEFCLVLGIGYFEEMSILEDSNEKIAL